MIVLLMSGNIYVKASNFEIFSCKEESTIRIAGVNLKIGKQYHEDIINTIWEILNVEKLNNICLIDIDEIIEIITGK